MYKISDPYFKELLMVVLKLMSIFFVIWCSVEIIQMLSGQDRSNYIQEYGVEPTHEVYEEIRNKSFIKRFLAATLFGLIIQFLIFKLFIKKSNK
jgi:spore cortex formation protein SpoVR/YcgB (stage V sporulation)